MTARTLLVHFLLLSVLFCGCNTLPAAENPGKNLAEPKRAVDPQQVQASTTAFAQRYMIAMADVFDRVKPSEAFPIASQLAQQQKLVAGVGAMGNAVNPNPIVGLMDMALMVTLTNNVMEDPWARESFGPDNQAMILQTLKGQESDIWTVAGAFMNEQQIQELRDVAKRWRQENPDQHLVGGARLGNFPEAKQSDNAAANLANSIFGLVRLDPFAGLDPAVRQVEESRILAERMFYYLQYTPTLIAWQTDVLYVRMITQPQVTQFLKDTTTVSANTTDFTKATTDFAEASSNFAASIEKFRQDLPRQQETLVKQVDEMVASQRDGALRQANADITALRDSSVKQLNDVVAVQRDAALKQADGVIAQQRDAALKQANDVIAAQRDAAIKQLSTEVTAQQQQVTSNLQTVLDGTIDRLYQRIRSLILIAGGTLLAVLVLYRIISRFLAPKGGRKAGEQVAAGY